jgi:branched-chain amino acid transport system substrate-binding protein
MRMISGMVLAVAVAVACGVLGGVVRAEEPKGEPVKIGSLQSMTGLTSTFGTSSDKGIRLAAEERNKAGGVLGRPVEIVTGDTESDPSKTPLAVLKLIEQDKVCAVIGEVASSRSIAAAPKCQAAKVPLLSPASTNPRVTKLGNFIFRSCFTDDFQGVLIAKFTANDLKLKKAAVLTDIKNDYSTGLTKVLDAEFPKLGGTIVLRESYQAGDTTFKTQLANIKAANPDIVFLPGYYTEIALILNEARQLGITCPFIGGDGWDSEVTIKNGGKAVEGCYLTNHVSAPAIDKKDLAELEKEGSEKRAELDKKYGKEVVAFVIKFMKRYNNEVPDAMAVLGYDATNIMFEAIGKAGSTEGDKIREALGTTKDFAGVTGNITIGKDRNAVKPGVVLVIKDGKFELVKRVEP